MKMRELLTGLAFPSVLISVFCSLLLPDIATATPEFSERTGQGCTVCHIRVEGGELNRTGLEYAASGYQWPPTGGYRVLGPMRKGVRLVLGYLHILGAFIWFGTILYVHLLLRPAYASKGLPKGEVMLGLVSMGLVGVSGMLLTVSRIRSVDILFATPWGNLLVIKIVLYSVMVLSALFVVTFLGPRMRQGRKEAVIPKDGVFDPATLSHFDGKNGRQAFIAYGDAVYDMGGLKLWRNGTHMKHMAGEDLTASLQKAPHGEEKLEGLKVVGSYDASLKPPLTTVQKLFYSIAYMNLGLVFAVLFVIALWRWSL